LEKFDTVIMGRKTYELGYKWGVRPGYPAYPKMRHYIFSNTLSFERPHELVNVCNMDLKYFRSLRHGSGSDIYLAGGGALAGWLFDNQLVDVVRIKLNPLILGGGTRLFGSSKNSVKLVTMDVQTFEDGLQTVTYSVQS
jgi:dihydrofolate reductase